MARPSILEAVERKRAAEAPPRNAAPQPAKAAPAGRAEGAAAGAACEQGREGQYQRLFPPGG